jgi:hypothetical protein
MACSLVLRGIKIVGWEDSDQSSGLLTLYHDVRFSNRPTEVKRFQTIRRHGIDVARGLALLFGIGTTALPSWGSRIRWNNLCRGIAVR